MDQAVDAVFNLDEGAEVRQVTNPSVNASANLVTLVQRLPRVLLHLLHAQTDATRLRIDAQHFNLNHVARVYDFARMLDALGPAHLGDMDQTFNARLELYEGAVVSHACYAAADTRSHRETFFDAGPGIGQQLLVTERDAFAFLIELQHLDLDRVADFEQLVWILQPAPRHVGHVQ